MGEIKLLFFSLVPFLIWVASINVTWLLYVYSQCHVSITDLGELYATLEKVNRRKINDYNHRIEKVLTMAPRTR